MNFKNIMRVVKVAFAAYAAALGVAIVLMIFGLVLLGGDKIGAIVENYIGLVIGILFLIFLPVMYKRLSK